MGNFSKTVDFQCRRRWQRSSLWFPACFTPHSCFLLLLFDTSSLSGGREPTASWPMVVDRRMVIACWCWMVDVRGAAREPTCAPACPRQNRHQTAAAAEQHHSRAAAAAEQSSSTDEQQSSPLPATPEPVSFASSAAAIYKLSSIMWPHFHPVQFIFP